jgi:group I intron endonuclease
MDKICGIYKITSPSNRVYIGQSRNYNKRINGYKKYNCKGQPKLYNSLKKYGFKNHIVELVHELTLDIDQKDLNYWELFYYNKYKNEGFHLLNLRECGANGKFSEESRLKMSISGKNKIITEEHKRNMGLAQKGRKHTEETKKKMSAWQKGTILGTGKPILKLDLNMNLIKEYASVTHAQREENIPKQNITECCKKNLQKLKTKIRNKTNKFTCRGFIWEYKNKDNMKEISETGYWNGETAHIHHVHCKELSKWICEFLKENVSKFDQITDQGCGLGNYLKDLEDYGFDNLLGYEADIPKNKVFDNIRKQDLTKLIESGVSGTVISLEVGEHIPKEHMNTYLSNITNFCNKYLITSWAIRGQEGFGHVNCLDNHEVIPLIEAKGFKLMEKETEEVRNIDLSEAPWFKNTLLIFKRV